jgi:aryl-alcohol dehydrogenase-like predicted oxidoreductase
MHQRLGKSDIEVFPLCLGGNVFGWTADEQTSFAVLDAYVEAGGNFIDTADAYSHWTGNGGISETIIGKWMQTRNNRDQVIIATKVGSLPSRPGLSAANIQAACDESLQRLQTDHIDVYFAHRDYADTPLEETLGAFDQLVRAGKVRIIGASNYTGARLEEALKVSEQSGGARYEVVQNQYNLMERSDYEDDVADVIARNGLGSVPYYGLASGFLTGKYGPGTEVDSVRSSAASDYLNSKRGPAVLEAIDAVAKNHTATLGAVALAWLAAQPTVTAPIASARTPQQLTDLLPMARLQLSEREIATLNDTSA